MIHPRAQAFLDAYDLDTTIVDVTPADAGEHRCVVINLAGKSWVFDFAHASDYDFVDVRVFDDTEGVEQWHKDTAAMDHPDGLGTPVGVFGMTQGRRSSFQDDDGPYNHGWPAAAMVTLLVDHSK